MISIGLENNNSKADTAVFSGGKDYSKIHELSKNYDFNGLRELLNSSNTHVDVNEKDFDGRTALHIVLLDGFLGHLYENDMISCVRVLIEFHADVNARDRHENSPLSLAVKNVFSQCTKILLGNGAQTSAKIATSIAVSMPDLLLGMFDDGVSVESDKNGKVFVKLDWRPILQFPIESGKHQRFKNVKKETEFMYGLLDVKLETRSRILKHPLVEAFIHFKTVKMASRFRLFYFISILYPLFYMIFIYFLYFERCKYKAPSTSEDDLESNSSSTTPATLEKPHTYCDITIPISVASYLLTVVVAAWGVIELLLQFRVDRRYLTSWRVWVIRVTIVVMGFTLWPGLQINDVYNITWQYPIASMGTFLAWVMFMIQIGSYHYFSIYLEMLVKILLSVVKISLMFLPLFIGFFMGFNLMFSNMEGVFSYIMMTVDVGAVAYDTLINDAKESQLWFQMLAYTFCVVFIIVIVIVFMNFLLALSIRDVEQLKGQAKMTSLARQLQNLFVIDLVDPSSILVSNEMRESGIWWYTYSPSEPDNKLELPKEIRMKVTLLLKSKNLQRLRKETYKSEMQRLQSTAGNDVSEVTMMLMKRIENLEKKLDYVSTTVMKEEEL